MNTVAIWFRIDVPMFYFFPFISFFYIRFLIVHNTLNNCLFPLFFSNKYLTRMLPSSGLGQSEMIKKICWKKWFPSFISLFFKGTHLAIQFLFWGLVTSFFYFAVEHAVFFLTIISSNNSIAKNNNTLRNSAALKKWPLTLVATHRGSFII